MNSFLLLCFMLAYVYGFLPTDNIGRIVGGHDISIEEAPYQISLQYNGGHKCGGSIISKTHIVTAAHCIQGVDASLLSIRAGSSIREVGGQVVNVSLVHGHSNYNETTIDYDIAILELQSSLTFGKLVAPIELPSKNQSWPAGTEVFVSGWGLLDEIGSELPSNLQGVTVEIVDAASCQAAYHNENPITNRMLCARVDGGGKDSCGADSGGPLAVDGVLGGVVSFGTGCGEARFPGVYANVPALRSFIKQFTGL